jgi:hypothetical protein
MNRLKLRQLAACGSLISLMLTIGFSAGPSARAEGPDLDKLVGQPADMASSAYQYRADRPAKDNPPETEFLFSAINHARPDALCGLLWEEPRPVKQVVLEWPAATTSIPRPDAIVLRWCPQASSASWWCRSEEGMKMHELASPSVSADGRRYTYTLDAVSNAAALDNLVVAVKGGIDSSNSAGVPTVRVVVPQTWKSMTISIEWGFQKGAEHKAFDGSIEAYNGIVGAVTAMAGDKGTRITGTNSWESRSDGAARRGIALRLLYVGYQDEAVWPGQANIEDVNRTLITLRTRSGSFSFLPADLEKGPILAPEHGFFVAKAAANASAAQFRRELDAKDPRTLRQQIHARAEQSWERAMRAAHPKIRGDFPPYPRPTVTAPMRVETPDPHLTAAWRIGATNMLRGAKKDERGKWRFRDPPYDALAHETHLFLRVLDLMGMHREARDGYEMWLDRAEQPVPTPDGMWTGGPATFFSGIEWDNAHGGGISVIHLDMLEHYCLTRDKAWLKENAKKLNANANWIIEQRKRFWAGIPGRERLWAFGLLPPHNIWDNRVWRSWYESNATFCLAIERHAEVMAEIEPEAARRFAEEGRAFRKDLLAAVEKSLTLSPVIRLRDGTYRSFLPPAPYMRGPASRFMPTNFSMAGLPTHSPGLYADAIRGGQHLVEFGFLPPDDPRVQGCVDVLEDRLLSENFKIALRFRDYDPQKDWFSRSGWYYQCGLERTANIHLQLDDPACFLRTWLNQYAVEIIPGQWTFREHTAAHDVTDKPFEEAAFLERFRNMLVREDGDSLRLAQAAPRDWFKQGATIAVKNAPTSFGTIGYEIVSDADSGKIAATVDMPSRNPPKCVLLRFRHPKALPMKSVTVDGNAWSGFDPAKEVVSLRGVQGTVRVESHY